MAEWNGVVATAAFKLGEQVVVFLPVRTASVGMVKAPARGAKPMAARPAPKRATKPVRP